MSTKVSQVWQRRGFSLLTTWRDSVENMDIPHWNFRKYALRHHSPGTTLLVKSSNKILFVLIFSTYSVQGNGPCGTHTPSVAHLAGLCYVFILAGNWIGWGCGGKKSIAIIAYNHWVLSLSTKTKVVQRVLRIKIRFLSLLVPCHLQSMGLSCFSLTQRWKWPKSLI